MYRYNSLSIISWINRDPIGERGGTNLYAFVGNDGVNVWDKLGLVSSEQLKDTLILLLKARISCNGYSEVTALIDKSIVNVIPSDSSLRSALAKMSKITSGLNKAATYVSNGMKGIAALNEVFDNGVGIDESFPVADQIGKKITDVTGKISRYTNLASAATSGDEMVLFLTIGSEFAPVGIKDFFGYYSKGYGAAVSMINNLRFSEGFVKNYIRLVRSSCEASQRGVAECAAIQVEKNTRKR